MVVANLEIKGNISVTLVRPFPPKPYVRNVDAPLIYYPCAHHCCDAPYLSCVASVPYCGFRNASHLPYCRPCCLHRARVHGPCHHGVHQYFFRDKHHFKGDSSNNKDRGHKGSRHKPLEYSCLRANQKENGIYTSPRVVAVRRRQSASKRGDFSLGPLNKDHKDVFSKFDVPLQRLLETAVSALHLTSFQAHDLYTTLWDNYLRIFNTVQFASKKLYLKKYLEPRIADKLQELLQPTAEALQNEKISSFIGVSRVQPAVPPKTALGAVVPPQSPRGTSVTRTPKRVPIPPKESHGIPKANSSPKHSRLQKTKAHVNTDSYPLSKTPTEKSVAAQEGYVEGCVEQDIDAEDSLEHNDHVETTVDHPSQKEDTPNHNTSMEDAVSHPADVKTSPHDSEASERSTSPVREEGDKEDNKTELSSDHTLSKKTFEDAVGFTEFPTDASHVSQSASGVRFSSNFSPESRTRSFDVDTPHQEQSSMFFRPMGSVSESQNSTIYTPSSSSSREPEDPAASRPWNLENVHGKSTAYADMTLIPMASTDAHIKDCSCLTVKATNRLQNISLEGCCDITLSVEDIIDTVSLRNTRNTDLTIYGYCRQIQLFQSHAIGLHLHDASRYAVFWTEACSDIKTDFVDVLPTGFLLLDAPPVTVQVPDVYNFRLNHDNRTWDIDTFMDGNKTEVSHMVDLPQSSDSSSHRAASETSPVSYGEELTSEERKPSVLDVDHGTQSSSSFEQPFLFSTSVIPHATGSDNEAQRKSTLLHTTTSCNIPLDDRDSHFPSRVSKGYSPYPSSQESSDIERLQDYRGSSTLKTKESIPSSKRTALLDEGNRSAETPLDARNWVLYQKSSIESTALPCLQPTPSTTRITQGHSTMSRKSITLPTATEGLSNTSTPTVRRRSDSLNTSVEESSTPLSQRSNSFKRQRRNSSSGTFVVVSPNNTQFDEKDSSLLRAHSSPQTSDSTPFQSRRTVNGSVIMDTLQKSKSNQHLAYPEQVHRFSTEHINSDLTSPTTSPVQSKDSGDSMDMYRALNSDTLSPMRSSKTDPKLALKPSNASFTDSMESTLYSHVPVERLGYLETGSLSKVYPAMEASINANDPYEEKTIAETTSRNPPYKNSPTSTSIVNHNKDASATKTHSVMRLHTMDDDNLLRRISQSEENQLKPSKTWKSYDILEDTRECNGTLDTSKNLLTRFQSASDNDVIHASYSSLFDFDGERTSSLVKQPPNEHSFSATRSAFSDHYAPLASKSFPMPHTSQNTLLPEPSTRSYNSSCELKSTDPFSSRLPSTSYTNPAPALSTVTRTKNSETTNPLDSFAGSQKTHYPYLDDEAHKRATSDPSLEPSAIHSPFLLSHSLDFTQMENNGRPRDNLPLNSYPEQSYRVSSSHDLLRDHEHDFKREKASLSRTTANDSSELSMIDAEIRSASTPERHMGSQHSFIFNSPRTFSADFRKTTNSFTLSSDSSRSSNYSTHDENLPTAVGGGLVVPRSPDVSASETLHSRGLSLIEQHTDSPPAPSENLSNSYIRFLTNPTKQNVVSPKSFPDTLDSCKAPDSARKSMSTITLDDLDRNASHKKENQERYDIKESKHQSLHAGVSPSTNTQIATSSTRPSFTALRAMIQEAISAHTANEENRDDSCKSVNIQSQIHSTNGAFLDQPKSVDQRTTSLFQTTLSKDHLPYTFFSKDSRDPLSNAKERQFSQTGGAWPHLRGSSARTFENRFPEKSAQEMSTKSDTFNDHLYDTNGTRLQPSSIRPVEGLNSNGFGYHSTKRSIQKQDTTDTFKTLEPVHNTVQPIDINSVVRADEDTPAASAVHPGPSVKKNPSHSYSKSDPFMQNPSDASLSSKRVHPHGDLETFANPKVSSLKAYDFKSGASYKALSKSARPSSLSTFTSDEQRDKASTSESSSNSSSAIMSHQRFTTRDSLDKVHNRISSRDYASDKVLPKALCDSLHRRQSSVSEISSPYSTESSQQSPLHEESIHSKSKIFSKGPYTVNVRNSFPGTTHKSLTNSKTDVEDAKIIRYATMEPAHKHNVDEEQSSCGTSTPENEEEAPSSRSVDSSSSTSRANEKQSGKRQDEAEPEVHGNSREAFMSASNDSQPTSCASSSVNDIHEQIFSLTSGDANDTAGIDDKLSVCSSESSERLGIRHMSSSSPSGSGSQRNSMPPSNTDIHTFQKNTSHNDRRLEHEQNMVDDEIFTPPQLNTFSTYAEDKKSQSESHIRNLASSVSDLSEQNSHRITALPSTTISPKALSLKNNLFKIKPFQLYKKAAQDMNDPRPQDVSASRSSSFHDHLKPMSPKDALHDKHTVGTETVRSNTMESEGVKSKASFMTKKTVWGPVKGKTTSWKAINPKPKADMSKTPLLQFMRPAFPMKKDPIHPKIVLKHKLPVAVTVKENAILPFNLL